MKNFTIESKTILSTINVPVTVGSISVVAKVQAFISKDSAEFEYTDVEDLTFQGIPVGDDYKSYAAFKSKLAELGIDVDSVIDDAINKVLTDDVKEELVKDFRKNL